MTAPWGRANASRRIRDYDADWADDIDRRLLASCHPWQLDAVLDPSRWITLLIGRGGTKTTSMRVRLLRKLVRIKNAKLVYGASSRPMAEELMWNPLKTTCEQLGLVVGRDIEFHEAKLKLVCLRTGAELRLVGLDDKAEINKLRGQPFDEVDIDETSLYSPRILEELVHQCIEPRLGDRLGCIVMGGTPGHILRGLFYETTAPGSPLHRPYKDRDREDYRNWMGWSSHAWTLKDIAELPEAQTRYPALVNLWADALLKKERNGWSDDHPIWQREYLGRWASDNTAKVFNYSPERNQWDPHNGAHLDTVAGLKAAIGKLPSFKRWYYIVGGDKGSSDPWGLNFFALSPDDQSRTIYHVFSFERTGMHVTPMAKMIIGDGLRPDQVGGLYGVTGWPLAATMDSDQATLDEFEQQYGIRFVRADRKKDYKAGAIELVNGDLVEGKLKILKGSPLEQQLQELEWQEDQFGNLSENRAQANHSSDCLVYARIAVAGLFENGTIAAPEAPKPREDPSFFPERKAKSEYDAMLGGDSFDAMLDDGSGNYF